MNILRVIHNADPKSGGPIEGLRQSAAIMKDMGHTTELATLDTPGAAHLSDFPFPVHACGPGRGKYGYTPNLRSWIAANAHRFDTAVVHGLWNHASVGGWQGLRAAGLPYVLFTHGMMDPWFKREYPLKHPAKQFFWLFWQGKVMRDANAVLFTSEEERRLARNIFWGHDYTERVVAYGTSQPGSGEQSQNEAFEARVPEIKGKRFWLFLSRLHRKKGCDLLLDAFASISKENPDIHLVMAGPDQVGMKAELVARAARAGIAARIHWPGMLTGDAKWGAFRMAEAFVLPSHQENFGIVVAEAMACGTPVVITDQVNIWREVKACGGGIVRPDTKEGIEDGLRAWLNLSSFEKQQMAHAARAGYERHFQAEAAARDLVDVLQIASRGRK